MDHGGLQRQGLAVDASGCILALVVLQFLKVVDEVLLIVDAYLPQLLALDLRVGDCLVHAFHQVISRLVKSAQHFLRRGQVETPQALDLLDWLRGFALCSCRV